MNIEQDHLPDQVKESYKKLVVEKENGGITEYGMNELLNLLAHKQGAVKVLKDYVNGGMQHEAHLSK